MYLNARTSQRYLLGIAVCVTYSSASAAQTSRIVTMDELALALSTILVLLAIAASLVAGTLKILLLGRFRFDATWYAYDIKTVRRELGGMTLTNMQRTLRRGYMLASYLAATALTVGFLGFVWIFLIY